MMRLLTVVAMLGLLTFSVVPAMADPWEEGGGRVGASGNADNFSWTNGGDLNDLFGSPFLAGDTFLFTTQFLAQSAGDESVLVSDTVSVDVLADDGMYFTGLTVTAFGTYNITAPGGVDVNASTLARELGGLEREWVGPLETDPEFPIDLTSGSANGSWDGDAVVDIESVFPEPFNHIHIEVSNELIAFSTESGTASINAQFADLQIELLVVPEPVSLSFLALGGLVLLRRR